MDAIRLVIDNPELDHGETIYRTLTLGRQYAPQLTRKSTKRSMYVAAEESEAIDKWELMAQLIEIREMPTLINRFHLHMGKLLLEET